jgi:hypothetical protein
MRRSEVHAGRAEPRSLNRVLRWLASVVGLLLLAALAGAGPASAAENPYQRGPDPTRDSVAASRGTFATASVRVPEANGFTKGVIYYPTDASQGTFGAIAFVPGYNGSWAALEWTGPWLASFGFVVIGFEAINPGDGDTARGIQLLAALDYHAAQPGAGPDRPEPDGGHRPLDGWRRGHVRSVTAFVVEDRDRAGAGHLLDGRAHHAGAHHADGRAERPDGHAVVRQERLQPDSGVDGGSAYGQ